MATAAQYGLQITDSTGVKPFAWYTPAQAGCAAGTGTCSVAAPLSLAAGAGSWQILPWNSAGYGPVSDAMSFTVNLPTPAKVTLVSPTGTITTGTPTFTWNAVAAVGQYGLRITDSSGVKPYAWYTPAQAGCAAGTGTCSVASPVTLAGGAGSWQILPWNSAGYGPVSDPLSFTVNLPIPDIRGTYTGSGSETNSGCTNSSDNDTFSFTETIAITSQSGSSFSGSMTAVTAEGSVSITLSGTVDASGNLSGSLTLQGSQTGTLSFTGTVAGKTITLHFSGTTHEGSNSCTATGDLTATRP